ncbi:MAG TPA: hypothetical protein VJN96_19800 [Vicinamibacterales bacterium]|nr:hypothetical protein [Vicinamibacterales bacterium]
MRFRWVRGSCSALAAFAAIATVPGGDGRATQAPTATAIVTAYTQGRFDEAQAALIRVADFAAFQHEADAALTNVPAPVAEAFLLEASQAAFNTHHAQEAHDLLEDGCARVRRGAPGGEFERRWQAAALALLEADANIAQMTRTPLKTHLDHVTGRIDPGAIALARAITDEQLVGRFLYVDAPGLTPRTPERDAAFITHTGLDRTGTAVKAMNAARQFESARPEATLRLGFLNVTQRKWKDADSLLVEAEGLTTDAQARYLAALFRGRAFESAERFDEALAQYRRAAAILPAQSASIAVASLEFLSGRVSDANDRLQPLFARPAPLRDPWHLYFSGAYRDWPALLTAVREGAR